MLLFCGMVDAALNFQTQVTTPIEQTFVEEEEPNSVSSTQTGKFDTHVVQVNMEVDPTTKDDECMSGFLAQKLSKKAQQRKKTSAKQSLLNDAQEAEESEAAQDQNVYVKQVARRTEARLSLIYSEVVKDLKETIQERSYALFSGSESKYEKFFKTLEQNAQLRTFHKGAIQDALKEFDDVAEQHNALQIIRDVWERKLSALKNFSQGLGTLSKKGEKNEAEEQSVHQQIQQLEAQLNELEKVQRELMEKQGDRIRDSYQLAPLLREVTAHFTHNITLPPKDFNALILDQLLPLKGSPLPTFQLLTRALIEGFPDTQNACAHFHENIHLVTTCLAAELKSCPDPSIASAIVNACRTTEKLSTIQNLHVQLLQKTFQTFPRLAE
ncbi:MAG: hypothetical protein J6Z25_03900 [Opitutales bacterium]|nr:hypothetical protein [Opitutales bacterium]